MAKITGKTKVWVSEFYGPEEIKRDGAKCVQRMTYTDRDMTGGPCGFSLVGTAEITVDFVDEQIMVDNKIEALRAEVKSIKAKAEMEATALEGKIQQLLAICNESSAS